MKGMKEANGINIWFIKITKSNNYHIYCFFLDILETGQNSMYTLY